MNPLKYLIIAEIEKKGFILEFFNHIENAEAFARTTFDLRRGFAFNDMYRVEEKLKYFATYRINGNQEYVGNVLRQLSNGAYSVSIIKINKREFCLKSFIKERENHSWVINFDKCDKLIELFPHLNLIAN